MNSINSKLCLSLAIIGGLLLPQITFASDADANVIVGKSSTLSKGINQDDLNKCIYSYDQKSYKSSLVDPEVSYLFKSDLSGEFKDKKYCAQAAEIFNLTHALPAPQSIKVYGDVTVYYTFVNSKNKKKFMMIDNKGQILQLTRTGISSDKNFPTFVAKYPAKGEMQVSLEATGLTYPTSARMPDNMLRLTFKQRLTYGACLSCKTIGIADIAYDFDKNGVYIQSEILTMVAAK